MEEKLKEHCTERTATEEGPGESKDAGGCGKDHLAKGLPHTERNQSMLWSDIGEMVEYICILKTCEDIG